MDEHDETLQYPPASMLPEEVEYPRKGFTVEVYVHEVYGCCPASIEGDNYPFTGFVCMKPGLCPWALSAILQHIVAMGVGVTAVDLGIAKSGEDGYVKCPAWGPPTCEALVIFRLHPVRNGESPFDQWYEGLAKMGHHCVPSYFLDNFASEETKETRKKQLEEWIKAGRPQFWEGWRNMPAQVLAGEQSDLLSNITRETKKTE